MTPLKIGDGTAPNGWPAYSKNFKTGEGIICNFKNCGHTGSLGAPAKMDCAGLGCECSCCRFLAGATVHGVAYGRLPSQ